MKSKSPTPTIKGVFVNSHIKVVRNLKGEDGVKLLEKRYGKPLKFKYLEEVPVREEVRIIELSLDILADGTIPEKEKAFEAGRLHFRNFSNTPLGRLIIRALPEDFKATLGRIPYVAIHVFRHVKFSTVDLGNNCMEIILDNNDYPLDHFRGLFYEWMHFMNHAGTVAGRESSGTYIYTLCWT